MTLGLFFFWVGLIGCLFVVLVCQTHAEVFGDKSEDSRDTIMHQGLFIFGMQVIIGLIIVVMAWLLK